MTGAVAALAGAVAAAPAILVGTGLGGYEQRALLEAVLVGALAGVVGVHVVLRRLAFFTMAMTHATFPGLVLAALLGVNLYLGSLLFGVAVVVVISWLARRQGGDPTTAVGVVLSAGFALGVLLLSAQAGFSKDLTAYLVGSILTVQPADLRVSALVAVVVLAVLALLHKELVFGAFDPGGQAAAGYPVAALDLVLLGLIELTVVTSVPAVGVILAVALVVGPAAAARLWCERVGTTMLAAAGLGVASALAGLALSRWVDIAAGGAIVLVVAALFVLSLLAAPRHGVLTAVLSAGLHRTRTGQAAVPAAVSRDAPPRP